MSNFKEFLLTAFALIFQSRAKYAACLWTAFSIVSYYFIYIEALNFVVIGLVTQLALYNKIFWSRILELFVVSVLGVVTIVVLGTLIYYSQERAVVNIQTNLVNSIIGDVGTTLRILTYPIIPLSVAFYALMVSHDKFTFKIFSRMIPGAYAILEALFTKHESKIPFVFLILLYSVLMGSRFSLVIGTPFLLAWIYIYVLNMRFDFKFEAVDSNKLATNLL